VYWKPYNNNYASATASIGLGFITAIIVVIYFISFFIAALRIQKKRKTYLFIMLLLMTPVLSIFLIESAR
jgi:multisubunit Na+/H+ antiporter MnhE subunit